MFVSDIRGKPPNPLISILHPADLESFPVNSLILKSAQLEALGDRIKIATCI
jgi:hypothetical protein